MSKLIESDFEVIFQYIFFHILYFRSCKQDLAALVIYQNFSFGLTYLNCDPNILFNPFNPFRSESLDAFLPLLNFSPQLQFLQSVLCHH